jgi:hypothetical protein
MLKNIRTLMNIGTVMKICALLSGMLLVAPAVCGITPAGSRQDASTETRRVYLSGTGSDRTVEWEFFCTGGRQSGYWTTIPVPSCWEQQGFGDYNYGVNYYSKLTDPAIPTEQGRYRYRFEVPREWQGSRVHLVFEASMTDTEVKINGEPAGPVHQGGFYRFRYDITDMIKYGDQNLMEADVSKESSNASVNMAERRADYWNFGGIFRPVFLEIMPAQFIERTAIDAGADGHFRVEVFLGEPLSPGYLVRVQLRDSSGQAAGEAFEAPVTPGSDSLTLRYACRDIRLWTAETPNLYQAEISLMSGDRLVHRVTERFGFRTFEIRAMDGFYLNGQRILLKGVNRHSFRPESGRTLNPALNYEDVRLIKEMNMNTVRMSHYPPDPEFLDACDELGLYVLDELGGWQRCYETSVGRRLVRELVTRDVNHPSILFWDNGNEGGWNTELDPEFARWDPRNRPVLHPQQDHSGVETMHYRSYGETQEYLRGELIYFTTEFLHGLYDGGHGAGLYDYWEMMRVHPRCGGGLLWDFADQGVIRTDLRDSIDTDGNHGADGILGPHHEKEGSFYTIKEIWSPVHISAETLPADFQGLLPVENRFDFTNLRQCSFLWELGRFPDPGDNRSGHRVLGTGTAISPDVPPHDSGWLELGLIGEWQKADVLYLKALDQAGREIWTWSWRLADRPVKLPAMEDPGEKVSLSNEGGQSIVSTDDLELVFDPGTWLLKSVKKGGKQISLGNGPRFIAARRGDRTLDGTIDPRAPAGVDRIYREIPCESKLLDSEIVREGENLLITTSYFGPLSQTTWTISADGTVRLDYEYRYDGVVELMGIYFDYPETAVNSIRWLGEGPYRVWQNRLQGTRLDVWENAYNDAVPAETFTYPEFKGYLSGWSWASLQTDEGTIHMANTSPKNYLGIYTPRDGRDALLYTLPQTGIAVLDVIPAVRNKVNATDLIGPSSRPRYLSGPRKGTLYLVFE